MARASYTALLSVAVVTIALSLVPCAQAAAPIEKKIVACMDTTDAAGKFAGGCIGLIQAECLKPADADPAACAAKELAFWQGQLDGTLKRATKAVAAYPEMAKPQGDAQKAWLVFRDKACAIADHVDPGTMPGGSAFCRAEVTAERVFMLRRIIASLEEH